MENNVKHYQTNKFKSASFYVSIFLPFLIIYFTILSIRYGRNLQDIIPLLFFYIFVLPIEYALIKLWKVSITIDVKGIEIKRSNLINKAEWTEIIELKEYVYGAGETSYMLKTRSKKVLGFTSSIEECSDLLKEIESRTGLKFKQRL